MKRLLSLSAICIATALPLSGCGFQPLHAKAGSTYKSALPFTDIVFTGSSARGASGEKAEYLIRQSINDRMASASSTPYKLTIKPNLVRQAIGLRSDDVASRYDLRINLSYKLSASGKLLDSGTVSAISTFDSPSDPHGTTASTDNALRRAATEVADKLILKVSPVLRAQ